MSIFLSILFVALLIVFGMDIRQKRREFLKRQ